MKCIRQFFCAIIIAMLSATLSKAETITLNWGVDNQPYTTTTCEIGGDVILPSVSKRGHVFRGWQAEHFDRGTFADYLSVPTSVSLYSANYHGVRTPQKGDYITITNASDYHGGYTKEMHITHNATGASWNLNNMTYNFGIDGVTYSGTRSDGRNSVNVNIPSAGIYTRVNGGQTIIYFYSDANRTVPLYILYNGQVVNNIDAGWQAYDAYAYYQDISMIYSGTWRFVYDGFWEVDGINGWKPSEQIISE